MQELAETGARLAAPPVPAAGLVLGHQARGLQGLLDERIAEAHAMLAPGELVEMPDVEPQIVLAIEREQALHLGDRGALGRGGLPPVVQEPVIPVMLQPPADAPDRAGAVAQDVGGLHPGQLPVDGPQDHFLYFHGTLHSAARVGHGLLLGGHSCHAARSERSTHVSILGGQLTYPQQICPVALDTSGDAVLCLPPRAARWKRGQRCIERLPSACKTSGRRGALPASSDRSATRAGRSQRTPVSGRNTRGSARGGGPGSSRLFASTRTTSRRRPPCQRKTRRYGNSLVASRTRRAPRRRLACAPIEERSVDSRRTGRSI